MWLWIIVGVVGLLGAWVAVVYLEGRRLSRRILRETQDYQAALAQLPLSEIDARAEEFVNAAREQTGVEFNLEDWKGAAQQLDALLCNSKRRNAFFLRLKALEIYWDRQIAAGAFLGKLLERHAHARWRKEDREPFLEIPSKSGPMKQPPFAVVMKLLCEGSPGDLVQYVETAVGGDLQRHHWWFDEGGYL